MVEGGFQEESEARNKWNRARLTSTQLSTYFVGSVEMWDIELEARRRAAAAAGAGERGRPTTCPAGSATRPASTTARISRLSSATGHPPTTLLRRLLFSETGQPTA